MSNFRVFAWGWAVANAVQLFAHVGGFGPPFGLRSAVTGALMALSWGFAAVALFGDRRKARQHD